MLSTAQKIAKKNRATIFVEDGVLLATDDYPGDQFVMRIRAPKCARAAEPGSFVFVTCDAAVPMRRPLSIMRVEEDCFDILYKTIGDGLRCLSTTPVGGTISVLGPIGQPFRLSEQRPNSLLIGGGVGIPPMVFLAERLKMQSDRGQSIAILGSEIPFPFETQKSALKTEWLSDNIDSTMPLLESWGLPCRLATLAGYKGCFDGYVTDLADRWLQTLSNDELTKTAVFACGPTPMLKAVAALAKNYKLPCQVSLEEFMACAVGGCAGCAVKIHTPDGPAMKRVCVDGPVFEASSVEWH